MTLAQTTRILSRIDEGDAGAAEELVPYLYDELRGLAAAFLRRENPAHTLQPTALVHEAFLRLVDQTRVQWKGRTHFLAIAARTMRRILVDHARGKLRDKRGGGWQRVEITLEAQGEESLQTNLVDLDRALEELGRLFEREARVVELRYFAGLSVLQVAEILDVHTRTVERDWTMARAWLRRELGDA